MITRFKKICHLSDRKEVKKIQDKTIIQEPKVVDVPIQPNDFGDCGFYMIQTIVDILSQAGDLMMNPTSIEREEAVRKKKEVANFVFDLIPNPIQQNIQRKLRRKVEV